MVSKKKAREKKKDFVKQKLKVGKTVKANNATDTSFTAKALNVRAQQLGPTTLKTQLSLLKHHQAQIRQQAIIYIVDNQHLYPTQFSQFVASVVPLIVDPEHQVRNQALKFLRAQDAQQLEPFIALVLLYVHSAMTHITPAVRAESTLFLDVLLEKNTDETTRQGFVRTLELFMTLLGFSDSRKNLAAGSMSTTTMSFGKAANKTRLTHLKSLLALLERGLKPEQAEVSDLYHPDTAAMLVPGISTPFSFGSRHITEDSRARRHVLDEFESVMLPGLDLSAKEEGEIGRVAGRVRTIVGG